eukprot:6203988-Pleurochrysis_carterae.AAC.1
MTGLLLTCLLISSAIIPSGGSVCSLAAMLSAIVFGTIPTCDGIHIKMTAPRVSRTFVIASSTAPFCNVR